MFLAAFLLLAPIDGPPVDDLPADDARAAAVVLDRWAEANRGVTSVRATYRRRLFDHGFQTVTLTEGEFRHDPASGTLLTVRPAAEGTARRYECGGVVHDVDSSTDEPRWFWDAADGTGWRIDDDRREAERFARGAPFFNVRLTPDLLFPFAPGRPFPPRSGDWTFSVVRRTPDAVFLLATPQRAELAANYRSALLRFRRSDGTLRGVRYHAPSGDSARDDFFDEVEQNPGPTPRPTLDGYEVRDGTVRALIAPESGDATAEWERLRSPGAERPNPR